MCFTGGYKDVDFDVDAYYDDVLKFDDNTKTWIQVGILPDARSNHAVAVVNFEDVVNQCQNL